MTAHGTFFAFAALSTLAAAAAPPPVLANGGQDLAKTSQNHVGDVISLPTRTSRDPERDYFARTGIFPIMHAVAIRNDLIDANPWLPQAVFDAYSQAKKRRYEAMRMGWVMETLPWFGQELDETRRLMGDNFWPYGIAANKTALNALFRYSHEQGLASRRLTIEELFHSSTLELTETL